MIEYPLAILKFTWSDTPWQGNRPQGLAYDDALVNRLYLPLAQGWGIAGYWSRATFELLNLEGSEVFPWRKLDNLPPPTPARRYLREEVAGQAIRQALAEEWPLDRFKGIVALVAPMDPDSDAGGASMSFCRTAIPTSALGARKTEKRPYGTGSTSSLWTGQRRFRV